MAASRVCTLQRQKTENSKTNISRKGTARGLSPDWHIRVSVSDLYIPTDRFAYSAAGKFVVHSLGIYKSFSDT